MKNEDLTIDEMKARYNGEWVLIKDPEFDSVLRVVQGKVVAHHANRAEIDRIAIALHLKKSAFLCFQETPKGMVYVL